MKQDIVVTVTARSGVGKSTIAELIQHTLKVNGFDSTHVVMEELAPSHYLPENYNRRLEAIRENTNITVMEQQARRAGVES